MTKPKPVTNDPAIMDNPHAPEVFAEGALGFLLKDGNVHLTFSAARVDHRTSPGPINRVVVGRVVMPLAGARGLVIGLGEFLKRQGVDMDPAPVAQSRGEETPASVH